MIGIAEVLAMITVSGPHTSSSSACTARLMSQFSVTFSIRISILARASSPTAVVIRERISSASSCGPPITALNRALR